MRPGYELVKEQIFFRKELRERVLWAIKIRWVFAVLALAGLAVAAPMGLDLPVFPLAAVCAAVLLYNAAFARAARWIEGIDPSEVRPFTLFAHCQISCDLAAVFVAVWLSGGMSSPFLIFALFHIILAGILLPPASTFAYVGAALLLTAVTALAQQLPQLGLPPVSPRLPTCELPGHLGSVVFQYLIFAGAVVFSAFLTTSIRAGLRTKGRNLLRISKELEASNARLIALYEMVKEIGRHSGLKELLDSATRHAANLMGVRACSIKLLDEQKRYLEFAATYGLSEDYLSQGKLDLSKSPINREIIEGKSHVIGRIDEKDYFQYPENIEREGISSMLCLPLRGNNMTLGVFCIYGDRYYLFGEDDVEFFGLMSDLTGIAIERVKWDLTKSWFMAKAAHNLRAPIGAVLSMVKLVRKGYLGPVNDKQAETLERCEVRMGMLADLISDLLRIGKERTEMGKSELRPVAAEEILGKLEPMFRDQALQKGIEMNVETRGSGLWVLADANLLDDLFANLISNAVKYTPPGGTVKVFLGMEGDNQVRFEVADTGIGISKEDLPKLFSEFFRTEAAKELVEEGTGLGLVIVKEILDRLGGKIHVESEVGKGTRMSCLIPASRPA
ncbi:MAG TPA: GAF domain-containing sensor histidine kinase [Syntrophobacteraceae bacterium]|nr:GAF domain-containing sensor histidine kinase [Syntrophobacteraceae bacterium]